MLPRSSRLRNSSASTSTPPAPRSADQTRRAGANVPSEATRRSASRTGRYGPSSIAVTRSGGSGVMPALDAAPVVRRFTRTSTAPLKRIRSGSAGSDRTDQYPRGMRRSASASISPCRTRPASCPGRSPRDRTIAVTIRVAASSVAILSQPGSAAASAATCSRIRRARPRRARRSPSASRNSSDAAHSRHARAGTVCSWTYTSSSTRAARSHRRPFAGSMIWMNGPCRRQATRKCRAFDRRVTTIAGSARAADSSR